MTFPLASQILRHLRSSIVAKCRIPSSLAIQPSRSLWHLRKGDHPRLDERAARLNSVILRAQLDSKDGNDGSNRYAKISYSGFLRQLVRGKYVWKVPLNSIGERPQSLLAPRPAVFVEFALEFLAVFFDSDESVLVGALSISGLGAPVDQSQSASCAFCGLTDAGGRPK